MSYLGNILIQFCLFGTCALSLGLLIGYSGLFALCYAALFGLGAYTSSLLMTKLGLPFALAWLCASLVGAALGALIAVPAARLKGDAFALFTLAFQVAVVDLLNNAIWLTRGPYGIVGIPSPSFLGRSFRGPIGFCPLAVMLLFVVILVVRCVDRSPFGRTLLAVRGDPLAAAALGKNVFLVRLAVSTLAGGIVGLGGAAYAGYVGYIDPSSFVLGESFFMVTMVVMGGMGNVVGPLMGAGVAVCIPEILRLLSIPSTAAPNLRQMLFGVILVSLMFLRPKGLWGRYTLK